MVALTIKWIGAGINNNHDFCSILNKNTYKTPAEVHAKLDPPWPGLQGPGLEEHLCSLALQWRFWPESQISSGTVSQPLFLNTHLARIEQSIHTKPEQRIFQDKYRRTCHVKIIETWWLADVASIHHIWGNWCNLRLVWIDVTFPKLRIANINLN